MASGNANDGVLSLRRPSCISGAGEGGNVDLFLTTTQPPVSAAQLQPTAISSAVATPEITISNQKKRISWGGNRNMPSLSEEAPITAKDLSMKMEADLSPLSEEDEMPGGMKDLLEKVEEKDNSAYQNNRISMMPSRTRRRSEITWTMNAYHAESQPLEESQTTTIEQVVDEPKQGSGIDRKPTQQPTRQPTQQSTQQPTPISLRKRLVVARDALRKGSIAMLEGARRLAYRQNGPKDRKST